MNGPVLVLHAMAIDIDIDVLEQLLDIKVASILRSAAAHNPCDGREVSPKGILLFDCVYRL